MKYRVVKSKSLSQLEADVTRASGEGWEPLGGIAVQGGVYLQAMKNEKPKPKKKGLFGKAE